MKRRRALGFLLVAYALAIGLLQLLWRTPALEWWWLQLLNIFGLWLYLPLPLALLLAPLVRPRRLALLLLVPLAAFAWEYGPQFASRQTAVEGQSLRVMSWNLLSRNRDIAAIEAMIREHGADVVALQELSVRQADALMPRLERDYPFHALSPAPPNGRGEGLGVWSRYPLEEISPPQSQRTGCSCQRLLLDVGGRPIRLLNVHPTIPVTFARGNLWKGGPRIPALTSFSTRPQEPALEAIEAEAQANRTAMVVVGDFNTHDRQPNYWRLRRYLQDAHRVAGSGFGLTFPNYRAWARPLPVPPFLRLDYVFYTPDLVATRAWNDTIPTSDHRAILADLVLDQTAVPTTAAEPPHAGAATIGTSSIIRRSSSSGGRWSVVRGRQSRITYHSSRITRPSSVTPRSLP